MVRVKVCGFTRLAECVEAVRLGVDVLGFIREPSSPRFFEGEVKSVRDSIVEIKELLAWTQIVGVYADWWGDCEAGVFDVLQGFEVPEEACERRVKVLRMDESSTVYGLLQEGMGQGTVLLDAYQKGVGGGTGMVVDWGVAREFVEEFEGFVVLAGGLGPHNVADAVRRVRPFGVDASSRLETSPGVKDLELVQRFVEEAKGA